MQEIKKKAKGAEKDEEKDSGYNMESQKASIIDRNQSVATQKLYKSGQTENQANKLNESFAGKGFNTIMNIRQKGGGNWMNTLSCSKVLIATNYNDDDDKRALY